MNIKNFCKSPRVFLFGVLLAISRITPPALYLKTYYYLLHKKRLNLKHPKTFNEKLNWLKLHYHNPLCNILADKYLVKDYVRNKIGNDYLVQNYAVWDTLEEVNITNLPEKFILKATHDSGGAFICKNKANFPLDEIKKRLAHKMSINYYYRQREWVYKDLKPRIIADQLLEDGSGRELRDYKFWCFNGEPKVMYITNKGKVIEENFYDMEYNILEINHGFPRTNPEYEKPKNFDKMRELAKKLSENLPFVRVDFFNIDGKVYFGEFTFYDWAGLQPFHDNGWDEKLGSWIKLPIEKDSYC